MREVILTKYLQSVCSFLSVIKESVWKNREVPNPRHSKRYEEKIDGASLSRIRVVGSSTSSLALIRGHGWR